MCSGTQIAHTLWFIHNDEIYQHISHLHIHLNQNPKLKYKKISQSLDVCGEEWFVLTVGRVFSIPIYFCTIYVDEYAFSVLIFVFCPCKNIYRRHFVCQFAHLSQCFRLTLTRFETEIHFANSAISLQHIFEMFFLLSWLNHHLSSLECCGLYLFNVNVFITLM